MLANELQVSSPSNIKKESKEQEEATVHEEEESCTKEEPEWYQDYLKMLVSHLSVPMGEETIKRPQHRRMRS